MFHWLVFSRWHCSGRIRGVALLGEVWHWGRALRFQNLTSSQLAPSLSLSVSAIAPAPCLPFAIHHTTVIMDQSSETEYNVHGIFMCDSKELRLTHMSPRARAAHCTFSEMLLSHEKGWLMDSCGSLDDSQEWKCQSLKYNMIAIMEHSQMAILWAQKNKQNKTNKETKM